MENQAGAGSVFQEGDEAHSAACQPCGSTQRCGRGLGSGGSPPSESNTPDAILHHTGTGMVALSSPSESPQQDVCHLHAKALGQLVDRPQVKP